MQEQHLLCRSHLGPVLPNDISSSLSSSTNKSSFPYASTMLSRQKGHCSSFALHTAQQTEWPQWNRMSRGRSMHTVHNSSSDGRPCNSCVRCEHRDGGANSIPLLWTPHRRDFHSNFLSLFPRFSPFGCRCALPFAYAHGTRGMHNRIYAEIILVAVLPVGVVAVQVGKAFNS